MIVRLGAYGDRSRGVGIRPPRSDLALASAYSGRWGPIRPIRSWGFHVPLLQMDWHGQGSSPLCRAARGIGPPRRVFDDTGPPLRNRVAIVQLAQASPCRNFDKKDPPGYLGCGQAIVFSPVAKREFCTPFSLKSVGRRKGKLSTVQKTFS
jgi:hypothetical protein